jgi:hypothetical protein
VLGRHIHSRAAAKESRGELTPPTKRKFVRKPARTLSPDSTPGVHHVRFSIADTDYPDDYQVAKGHIDSALFIKGGSLRTINPAQ